MQVLGVPRIAVAAIVLAAGCGNPSVPLPGSPENPEVPAPLVPEPAPSPSEWRTAQALSVDEAVYRYQFRDYRNLPPVPLTYCLARTDAKELLPWTDPPEELLRRFRDHRPPVKRMAVCRIDPNLNGVTDVETGGPAVIFRVAPLVWESDFEVVIDGGHHVNGLHGSGKTYRVRLQGGEWVVVDARWRWIS